MDIKEKAANPLRPTAQQQSEGKNNSSKDYIRVGNNYYKQIIKIDKHGNQSTILSSIGRQTLIDDFGKGFLSEVKKYDG